MIIRCKRCGSVMGDTSKISQEEIEQFKEERKISDVLSDEEIAERIIQPNILTQPDPLKNPWGLIFGVSGNYCQECLDKFTKARNNGALTIRKWSYEASFFYHEGYWIETKQNVYIGHKKGDGMSQVEAIVKAREIAKKEGIDTIIFTYTPHGSVWFLDNYLEAHPKIKKDVLKSEKGLIDKIKNHF